MNLEDFVKALELTLLVQANALPEPTHFLSFAMRISLWTQEKEITYNKVVFEVIPQKEDPNNTHITI